MASSKSDRNIRNLPDEIIRHATFSGVIWVALSVIFLVLAANFLISLVVNASNPVVQWKWQVLEALEEPVDWLILGDSSGDYAVSSEVIKQRLGVTSVNLATIGDVLAVNDAWMLGHYIDRFGPPSNVLVIHTPPVWSRDLRVITLAEAPSRVAWNRFMPSLGVLNQSDNLRVLAARFIGRHLPLYFQDRTFPPLFRTPWRWKKALRLDVPELNLAAGREQDYRSGLEFVFDAKYWHGFFSENDFKLSEVNIRALDQITRLSDQHGFDVYIIWGPVFEEVSQDEAFQEYISVARSQLGDYISRTERLHLLWEEPLTFPEDQMAYTIYHITSEGAEIYTNSILDSLDRMNQSKSN